MSPNQSLTEALFGIYATAGKEVEYTTEKGERRAYWANRFRQALQRAVDEGDVVGFVERLVYSPNRHGDLATWRMPVALTSRSRPWSRESSVISSQRAL